MTENPNAPGEPPDPNPAPAGTQCALCGTDLSPSDYPNCRTVLIDETGPGDEEESVRMVCGECFAELDDELTTVSESRSGQSV